MEKLEVYLHDAHAATLERQDPWSAPVLRYEESYRNRSDAIALSRRLQLDQPTHTPKRTSIWMEGLLPEGDRRVRIARQVGANRMSTWSMLEAIGAECAGAVEVHPAGDRHARSVAHPINEQDLARIVERLERAPLGPTQRAARLSLAGAQAKFVLVQAGPGKWSWPEGGYPSTHIIKPDMGVWPGIVANEHAALTLAARCGLPAARSQIGRFGPYEVLIVERFDRTPNGERIHQEDFAQALGTNAKYQSERGPALHEYFARSGVGGWELWDQVAFAWLIGNEDAHAKNFSVQYPQGEAPRLSPIYDAVCTTGYPELERRMAWKIGNAWRADEVTGQGLQHTARRCGLNPREALARTHHLAERIQRKLTELTREGMNTEPLERGGVRERCEKVCEWN